MKVLSLRLSSEEQRHILKWATQEKKAKSEAARELLRYGWRFILLEHYRQGKISLGRLARELEISIPEAMDFVAEHGAPANLDYEEYLQGLDYLRKEF